jgi:hypothetical protein
MKKLVLTLLVLILVLTACGSQAVEPGSTVVEPPAQVEQPTEAPVITEELIEVPTVEPTEEPTLEPTAEPKPSSCPAKAFEVIQQDDLVAEVEEYGVFEIVEGFGLGGEGVLFLRLDTTMIEEYEVFTFIMPSAGFIYILEDSTIVKINNELWHKAGNIAVSPEGNIVIPRGAIVEISQERHTGTILEVEFIAGKVINEEEIIYPPVMSLSCEDDGLWLLTITNPSENENYSFEIETEHKYLITDFEKLVSIKYPWTERDAADTKIGYTATKGDLINLLPGGFIKFVIYETYPYNRD